MAEAKSQHFQFTGTTAGRYDSQYLSGTGTIPSAPQISAAGGTEQVVISLNGYSADTVTFTLQRATNAAFTSGLTTISSTLTPANFPYANTGLAAYTAYYYRMSATSPAGTSSYGSDAAITNLIAPTLSTPSISGSTASVAFSGGSYGTLIPAYRLVGAGSWTSLSSDTSTPFSYTGLAAGNYEFEAWPNGVQASASNRVTATVAASGAVLFSDDFERAALTGQPAQNSINWSGTGGGNGGATLVPDVGRNSTSGVLMRYNAGADGTDSSAEIRQSPCGRTFTEYCVSYFLFLPSNFTHRSQSHLGQSANNKGIMQSWSGPYSAVNSNQYIGFEYWPLTDGSSSLSMRAGRDGVDLGHSFNGGESGSGNMFRLTERGKWIQFKAHIKLASGVGATDGTIRAWKWVEGEAAAELLYTKTNWAYSTRGNFIESFYYLGWANSGFAAQTDFIIDKFRMSDTLLDWESF